MVILKTWKKGIVRSVQITAKIQELNISHSKTADDLGIKYKDQMVNTIERNKKRPGGQKQLESSIKFYQLVNGVQVQQQVRYVGLEDRVDSWGVGYFPDLPVYWRAINWGFIKTVGSVVPPGEFAPGTAEPDEASFRQGRWNVGTGNYSFIIGRPIYPMNYIEKTNAWFGNHISRLMAIIKQNDAKIMGNTAT